MTSAYDSLRNQLHELGLIRSVAALLSWDQETVMPKAAAGYRAEQLSLLARTAHQKFTDESVGELIERCLESSELQADPIESANLRELQRDYELARKLPEKLVVELSETASHALEAWREARENNDYAKFQPWLERQLDLNRQKAACYGVPTGGTELYDALLDAFEPTMTSAQIEALFAPLRAGSVELIKQVKDSPTQIDGSLHLVELPLDAQRRFNEAVLAQVGFDSSSGRLDVSTHPFSTGIAPGDVRITTRYRLTHFADALGSTLHEAGHAMYEQGIPRDTRFGEPIAESVSLGIHESQSRLWENHVGRSQAFWNWATPLAHRLLGEPVTGYSANQFFRALNIAEPHLIRVESDELTYNLHVMLRFDIERALLRGDLTTQDLPTAWNDRMKSDLGLVVPSDSEGCLQDIHWSMGSIGYFPTYTLGNLYAAQFWAQLETERPQLDEEMSRGEFGPILDWLRNKIHRFGRQYSAAELCEQITGKALSHDALLRHLNSKMGAIYQTSSPSPTV